MRYLVLICVVLTATGCGRRIGPTELAGRGDFRGCISTALAATTKYPDNAAGYYNTAAECSEALGDRIQAIEYYNLESQSKSDVSVLGRIAALKNNAPLKAATTVQAENQAVMDDIRESMSRVTAEQDDDESGSQAAGLRAMAGVMRQPGFVPRGRGSSYVAPSYMPSSPGAAPQRATMVPRQTYRDATQCARMSPLKQSGRHEHYE